jgi:hypothetical protein
MGFEIIICDGRAGRNEPLVDDDGFGEVLGTATVQQPVDIGDVVALPDGTKVMVIGTKETIGPDTLRMKVAIGNLPAPPQ